LAICLAPIVRVLFKNLEAQMRIGVHRPYAGVLARELRDQILARIAKAPGVELVFMARSELEHGFGVDIVLSCPEKVDPKLATDIRTIVHDALGNEMDRHVLWLRAAVVGR
jgi:hypothetical protein